MSPDPSRPPVETLLVDDVERLRRMVADELGASPAFDVVGEAANGEEAIQQAKALEPDLVLLDLSMPRMDGLEALTEIRRQVPGTAVVVLSGFTSERMAAVARDHGALAYIKKGIEPDQLVARLRSLVGDEDVDEVLEAPTDPEAQDAEATRVHVVSLHPPAAKTLTTALASARPGWRLTHAEDPHNEPVPEDAEAIALAIADCQGACEPTVRSLSARNPETPVVVAVPDIPQGCFDAALRGGAGDVVDLSVLDGETLATEVEWTILREKRERERTRRLEMLAGTMAHDLRRPMRALERYADWIEEGLVRGNRERVETAIEGIQGGIERTRRLIDSQLTYARLQTQPPAPERTDARDPLEDVLEELADRIDRTEARIEVGELPEVVAPPEHVAELFRNLLSNAIKYREDDEGPHVEIRGESDGNDALIHVVDDGIGIPAEHQDEIFDPFSRLHAERDYPGTGLGLAICQQIVEQWGGAIEVDAALGEGTTMTVRLPAPDSR